jgi:hypothetical protein
VVIASNDPNARDPEVRRRTGLTPGELGELKDLLSLVLVHHEDRRDDAGELRAHLAAASDRVLATRREGPSTV